MTLPPKRVRKAHNVNLSVNPQLYEWLAETALKHDTLVTRVIIAIIQDAIEKDRATRK